MGFLIKTGFWLGIVLLMIPVGPNDAQGEQDTVGPLQALHTATEVIGDLSGICERKPGVCRSGAAIARTIGVRARDGIRLAYEAMEPAKPGAGQDDMATASIKVDD